MDRLNNPNFIREKLYMDWSLHKLSNKRLPRNERKALLRRRARIAVQYNPPRKRADNNSVVT